MKHGFGILAALAALSLVPGCCCPSPCAPSAAPSSRTTATSSGPAPSATTVKTADGVARRAPAGPGIWDALLRKYVQGDYFDYAALKANAADRADFARFLDWQGKVDISSMSREQKIAFYMNVYNSLNVKMILENYPVHSPLDIPGFFDKIKHPVAGEMLTISEAEYERLIANYGDMRAHFGVVCADRGCLPLMGRAWTAETLDADLNAAATRFLADERHFKVDHGKKQIWISKIFEWYGEKFTKDAKRPASRPEEYLKYWATGDVKKALESGDYEVKIIEWNWTLNEKLGA